MPEAEFSAKPLPHKWSKKEILGHLIDSGHNNLRRFICGQYTPEPPKITYEQDFWVAANAYQQAAQADVVLLWRLINERICAVLAGTPEAAYTNLCDTGSNTPELHTLAWLAEDYVRHMRHHLRQIVPQLIDTQPL